MTDYETDPSVDERIEQLRMELREELRAELRAKFEAEMEQLHGDEQRLHAPDRARTSSRRQVLITGGAAVSAGVAAAAAFGRPATAADGAPIIQSQVNSGTGTTAVTTTGVGEAALDGVSNATTGTGRGVLGRSDSPDGTGVTGFGFATTGSPTGVYGQVGTPTGRGVHGYNSSTNGLSAGVHGETWSVNGAGVVGESYKPDSIGVWGKATTGTGVVGTSQTGIGGRFSGVLAALRLGRSGNEPALRIDSHRAGEVYFDDQNELWLCTQDGTPGRWTRLTGPPLTPVSPFRVYDSRFGDGRIATGEERTMTISDAIDTDTGAVITPDAVPDGTTAIAFTITVTATQRRGFLSVTPGDATELSASTINWGATGNVLANGTFVTLDQQRQIKVFAGGPPGSSTEFVIDITGVMG